jgi:succinate dehydrogenase hydrophobic anchor subunit
MICDRRKTCLFSRVCRERLNLILEDNFESIHRRMTIFSKDCSSNQEKTQQNYEEETNHRNAMKIFKFFLMIDWSYHFFNFLKKLIEQYLKNEEIKRIIKIVTHYVMHSTLNRKFII